MAREAIDVDVWSTFVRGVPAGWLIALAVSLRLIALYAFTHVIARSVEYLYLVVGGAAL